MIKAFQIEATEESPRVDFNAQSGQLQISGTSISHESDKLFSEITYWLDEYLSEAHNITQIIINLDYFNISTSKHLLAILYKLKELENTQKLVTVEWHYNEAEDDMLELGQDYEMMVRLPFKYVGHKHANSEVC